MLRNVLSSRHTVSSARWRNSFERTPGIAIFISGFTFRKKCLSTAPFVPYSQTKVRREYKKLRTFFFPPSPSFPPERFLGPWRVAPITAKITAAMMTCRVLRAAGYLFDLGVGHVIEERQQATSDESREQCHFLICFYVVCVFIFVKIRRQAAFW